LEQQVQQLLEENSRMSAALRSVQLAQRTSSGTALEAAQGLQRLQDKVVQLQGADARTEQLERQLGHVQSRQQRMAEQQHLDDCQRSVIYKTPTPLPSQNAERAKAAAEQLSKLLVQPVAVLSAQELCGRPGSNGSGRRSVYKVRLASSEARDVVLRVKAARLRGTQYTIDVCLTPQQKARVDQLLPIFFGGGGQFTLEWATSASGLAVETAMAYRARKRPVEMLLGTDQRPQAMHDTERWKDTPHNQQQQTTTPCASVQAVQHWQKKHD
jgi:hypothetical protein